MCISERIQQYIERLPAPLQIEALDFVEYLLAKAERDAMQEGKDWSDLSLSLAMRGMEDEETPLYTVSDLKVVF
jgi:hypothetical protein